MAKLIVIKFEAVDNLRRALSRYVHGKKGGMVTKRAVKVWAEKIIEMESLDLQLRLSKGKDPPWIDEPHTFSKEPEGRGTLSSDAAVAGQAAKVHERGQ